MAAFGSFALLIALALAAYNLLAGALALRLIATRQPARISPERLADTARRAGIAGFVAVTAAAFALVWSVFANDFSITYIMEHSNRALPAAYKFSALWSGQEGSLLLWAWLLGTYGFVLRLTHKTDVKLYAYAGTILAGIQVFFLLVLNFAAPPFALFQGAIPEDGNGLNPLLQYPEMVIHPPMLYLGYVGFSVPFAFALGALMMRYPGEKWIKVTRVWTMVTWLFLTCGIFLGMHWAYAVLGWGGYWGWDPVENASFMPWLTGTAFLHSVMMQEKKGMMKSWNVWLIFSTFLLTLLGTLLTRAGLVSSVHAFAQSSIGTWFVVFMGIVLAVCIFTYVLQRSHLQSEHHLESLVSRESSFLFNNLVLLTACFVILWGTLFPILSEYVVGNKVTVGAPFYNRVAIPIGLFLLFLTGVGPLLPWRATSFRSIRRNFVLPVIALWATVIVCLAVGVRPWKDGAFDQGNFYALVACAGRRSDDGNSVGVPARSRRYRAADEAQHLCGHLAAHAPQHAALWRLHHPHWRGGDCDRAGGLGLQPQRGKRNGAPRQDFHRPLYAGVRRLYAGLEPELQLRVRTAGRLQRRKKAVPDDAGEAGLPGQRTAANHGGHSLGSQLGSLRGV
jgi:cytochrome c-type biogenesis protein CcmF